MSTNLNQKIYVAGHRGMVGSAIVRNLQAKGFTNIVTRTHAQLDLTNQAQVKAFFEQEKPVQVYLAAAKVGGIYANNTFPAEFIYQNLMMEANVIHGDCNEIMPMLPKDYDIVFTSPPFLDVEEYKDVTPEHNYAKWLRDFVEPFIQAAFERCCSSLFNVSFSLILILFTATKTADLSL